MYSFMNDYSEGAHPKVLELLIKSNLEQNTGYGEDTHTIRAKESIKKLLLKEKADIHFIPGGTQTNLLVISSFLRPFEAVIAADTGHINVHETGAIEATGHKVITVPNKDGKVTPKDILEAVRFHSDEHMVKTAMVYLSDSTELGTVYTKEELYKIRQVCNREGLLLFLDGARLGSALASEENDLELSDIAELTDVFYIGGTKNGALLGEALVIVKEELKANFRYLIKQRGALMAKGFVAGIQFEALFSDGLFFELGEHANEMAGRIRDTLKALKVEFLAPPVSNQLFPILPDEFLEELKEEFAFSVQKKMENDKSAVRFVTSWATTPESVEALCGFLNQKLKR
ncbi:threonine aldolase family protein [Anaerocolumna xylanovorans]|uniref:L-threonine aldolase n=1 Tax=Anaerocolumna xylanovorans DSM 12503 TaxID=1121345 RepID=A0A1M7XX50_9FIRM|nr:aminotransferase class I/II-fold pyridoxal phosphate-dependent enzyme [Anaerocolumna xylanovorans]SHO43443.1 L-threonine aldolase [Anaerocolumna xylanovorans DSM 12503]